MSSWKDSLLKECLALRNMTGWRGLAAKKYWAGMPSFSRGKKASSWGVMEFLSNLLGAESKSEYTPPYSQMSAYLQISALAAPEVTHPITCFNSGNSLQFL